MDIYLSCLTLLDSGFLCEVLVLYFPRQSKGFDFMHVLESFV